MAFTPEQARRYREEHPERVRAAERRHRLRRKFGLVKHQIHPRQHLSDSNEPCSLGFAPTSFPIGINRRENEIIELINKPVARFWKLRRLAVMCLATGGH